jgi:hypothetical protein
LRHQVHDGHGPQRVQAQGRQADVCPVEKGFISLARGSVNDLHKRHGRDPFEQHVDAVIQPSARKRAA